MFTHDSFTSLKLYLPHFFGTNHEGENECYTLSNPRDMFPTPGDLSKEKISNTSGTKSLIFTSKNQLKIELILKDF